MLLTRIGGLFIATYESTTAQLQIIDKAIKLNPNDADAYLSRGCLLTHEERAIEDLNKAIQLKPDYANARGVTI